MDTERVQEENIQGARVMVGVSAATDVVSIEGSVLGGPNHCDNEMTAHLLAELLDAGTKSKKKHVLRELLSARGATLHFWASGDRLYFSASCFPEDVSFTLSLITECLAEPALKPAEIRSAQTRILGELSEESTKTKALAASLLTRLMYPKGHIQRQSTVQEKQALVAKVGRPDILKLQKTIGSEGAVLAITGDIEVKKVMTAARRALLQLPTAGAGIPAKNTSLESYKPSADFAQVADKANIDTYFGRPLSFTATSSEFLPFMVAASMLGGKGLSTGHLMRTIRERDGLTYGIYALPGGFQDGQEGYFQIWGTFSPERYDHSVEATKKEIKVFLTSGLTEDILASKKMEMAGRFLISLSTTRGLAQALHQTALEGRDLAYLSEYPKLLAAVTLKDVREMAGLFAPEALSLAGSGTRKN